MEDMKTTNSGTLQPGQRTKKFRFLRLVKVFLFLTLSTTIVGGGAAAGYIGTLIKRAPELNLNTITNMAASTKVYDASQQFMFELQGDGDRDLIKSLNEVSPHVVHAFIAAEDKNFRSHFGVNPIAIARAAAQNVLGGRVMSGASTITQQTIKNAMFPEQTQSLERKVQEAYLAMELEKKLTKDEIMVTYLNWIYFGKSGNENLYGIERTSKTIFGVSAKELNLAQSTILAALPNNPSIFDVGENIDNTFQRQEYILREMLDNQYITQAQFDEAKAYDVAKDIAEHKKKRAVRAGEFAHLNAEIETRAAERLMESGKYESLDQARQALFRGGYSIYTTIDRTMQTTLDRFLNNPNYYPPNINYTVTDNKGKQIKVENAMEQSGAVLVDNKSGRVIAMGGGRNYELDQVNHATRPRQPGSTMKPIAVFGPALDRRLIGSGTAIDDVPMTWPDQNGRFFPMNWDRKFHGLMTARHALEQSYNIPALKVFADMTPKTGLDYVKRMGVNLSDGDYNLAAAIGGMSQGLTVLEATSAFSSIPNAGMWHASYMIDEIKDRNGNTVYKHQAKSEQIYDPNAAYILNDMLKGVTVRGTASDLGRKLSGYAIAGKTGTTDDNKDAWYVGYTPDVTLGIWVGYNIPYELTATQSRLPVRLWGDIMLDILPRMETRTKAFFNNPGGVRQVAVCKLSGKLPTELCHTEHTVVTEMFMAGSEPKTQCDVHVKAKYYEVGGKKYLADDSTPPYMVKEGIFIKRQKYTLPDNNKAYLPLDHIHELPEDKNGQADVSSDKMPGELRITSASINSVSLGWNAVVGAKSYLVLRAEGPGPLAVVSELESTAYTDTAIRAGQTYRYQVVAKEADGTHSAPSPILTFNPSAPVPELNAPAGVQINPDAIGLKIAWGAVTGATQYTVYRSGDGGSSYQKIATVANTAYTDIGALPGATFSYKITALADGRESNASAPVTGTASGTTTPGGGDKPSQTVEAPGGMRATDPKTGSTLVLNWNAVKNATSYSVERSTDGSSFTPVSSTPGTSYIDSGLTAGVKYWYRVRALSADGTQSPPSRTVSETPID